MTVNALRGHLAEFGLIAPKGIHRVKELLALALADETLREEAKQASEMLASHSGGLDEKIDDWRRRSPERAARTRQASCWTRSPPSARRSHRRSPLSLPIPGSTGREAIQRALGITPSQHSSGGKDKLGAITKKGNRYLRKMLVVGCTSVLRVATNTKGPWPNGSSPRGPGSQSASSRSPWPTSWQNSVGDDVDRRKLQNRTVYQGLKKGLSRIGVSFSKRLASATT